MSRAYDPFAPGPRPGQQPERDAPPRPASAGRTPSYLDAARRQLPEAAEFLDGEVTGALAARGVVAGAGP